MQLLVVRHAIAFERSSARWPDDAERPLTPEGAARARKAAQGLKRIGAPPARVLASPLRRAQETASILARFAGWPEATICVQLLPGAAPEELLALLARARDRSLAVVGHEPAVGRLIAACLPGGVGAAAFEMKKMGVALLEFPGTARAGRGRLVWLLPPKILRAVR
jgi:phosphohistidine phosphatase